MNRSVHIALAAAALAVVDGSRADSYIAPGFAVSTIATGLNEPVALAYAPDGRLFVAEREGRILIINEGQVLDPPFAELSVYARFECGLLGLALDPDFDENHYVYVFATVTEDEQRIIRLTEANGVAVESTVIRAHLPTSGERHNGGCLKFGPDGKLYFSIGDNGIADLAARMYSLAGKICRINRDGASPGDNPFVTPTGSPRATYALGFRNPFRFCIAPDGRLFVMDVGSDRPARREEINVVRAGDNCGWPALEGFATPDAAAEYVEPIFADADKGSAFTGTVYYTGDQFPPSFTGNLFHLEFVLNRLYRVELSGDRVVAHALFVQAEGGPVDLVQAPDGSLVYCELIGGSIKRVRSIVAAQSPDVDGSESAVDPFVPTGRLCGGGVIGAALFTLTVCSRGRFRR